MKGSDSISLVNRKVDPETYSDCSKKVMYLLKMLRFLLLTITATMISHLLVRRF